MKLSKRLFINRQEVTLASNKVNLHHSLSGAAIFEYGHSEAPKQFDPVRFDIGFDKETSLWFEGYIDKIYPSANGAYKVLAKEGCGILAAKHPISIEHATMREVLTALGERIGMAFVLPKEAQYTDRPIPNFTSQGTGYQCLAAVGKAFNVPDFIWYQTTNFTIYAGAFEHSRFYGKNVPLDGATTTKQSANSISFAPLPMLRPGVIINDKRVKTITLAGDEMSATWEASQHEQTPEKRKVEKEFPELAAGHHLPRFGQVKAVRGNASAGHIADPFRPRYAVDVQLLDENMQVDESVPLYKSIPLPINLSGSEAGLFGYPLEGCIVEVAFAYGRNDLPIVRAIYGRDFSLPTIEPGEQLQQQRGEVSNRYDAAGNQTEQTDQHQSKRAYKQSDNADHYQGDFGTHQINVDEHSLENIIGKKVIEALGAIELLAGDNLELGTLGNMHIATAGDLIEAIGKIRRSIAAEHQWLQAPQTWIGSKQENVLILLSDLMQVVKELADTLASHTHNGVVPGQGTSQGPVQSSQITGHGSDSSALKNRLDPISKQ